MKNIQRGLFAILLIFGISAFIFVRHLTNFDKSSASYDQLVDKDFRKNNTKYILTYTNFFTSNNWFLNKETAGSDFFRSCQCPVTDCVVTSRQDLLPSIAYFDALVFHGAEEWTRPIPTLRSPSQIYVAAIRESPAYTRHKLEKNANFFNWTMTYRTDSDVLWSYGQMSEINGDRRVVAPAEQVTCPHGSPHCSRMLTDEYRFYLSFENSLCGDYVTEKLYNAMENYIIPVVYGGANYSKFVPPHSVIDVQQFRTVKKLADYLLFLADNPEEYVKYFWWKEHYRVTRRATFCDLCLKLHEIGSSEKLKYYEDIKSWWFEETCQAKARIEF